MDFHCRLDLDKAERPIEFPDQVTSPARQIPIPARPLWGQPRINLLCHLAGASKSVCPIYLLATVAAKLRDVSDSILPAAASTPGLPILCPRPPTRHSSSSSRLHGDRYW